MKRIKILILLCIMTFAVSCGQQKRFTLYKVKEGETMRSIAKRNNLKTEDLLRLNPDISKKPEANTVIVLPTSDNSIPKVTEKTNTKKVITTKEVKPPVDDSTVKTDTIDPELEALKKNFVIHKVKAKETVYGLTRFFNISTEELFTLNPFVEQEGLKIGQIIKIRPIETKEDEEANNVFEDNINPSSKVKIALLLPFRADEYNNTNAKDIFSDNTLANIVTDFYMGAEIAIDSIKRQGVQVDVQVFDTGKKNSKINSIISNNNLNNVDAIIGPFYYEEVKALANRIKVPIVFPHFSKNQHSFSSSKIIKTAPDKTSYLETLTNYLSDTYTNENIIVVGDGKTTSNNNLYKIVNNLKKNDSISNVNVLKPVKGYIKKQRFIDIMKPETHTWVIVVSDDDVAVADALNSMISLPEGVTGQVFSIDKNKAFDRIDNFKLAKINFSYVTNEFIDEHNFSTKEFNAKYKQLNNSLPSNYATKGFDVTYDILARLTSSNNNLKETLNGGSSYRLVNKFDYKNPSYGTTNNEGLFIVKYNEDLSLTRLK